MLEIQQLSFSYGEHPVLKDLSLTVPTGSIQGILGTNGAGKTSFFKCLYGTLKPQTGNIQWEGQAIHFSQVAFLETHNYFYSYITGQEYLQLCTASSRDFPIEGWNKLFKLPLQQLVDTYSTGMKKQLAFMGVLAQNRPMIILDEPFNGLDLESSEKMHYILQRLRSDQKTILISSHILETLTRNCDRISHLADGQMQHTYEVADFAVMTEVLRARFRDSTNEDLDRIL